MVPQGRTIHMTYDLNFTSAPAEAGSTGWLVKRNVRASWILSLHTVNAWVAA